jgi:hypothetical protein
MRAIAAGDFMGGLTLIYTMTSNSFALAIGARLLRSQGISTLRCVLTTVLAGLLAANIPFRFRSRNRYSKW